MTIHWKDWCWSWKSNTLATWCEELIRLKRSWCWERLKVDGEGDDRGWDGWMASLTRWTRVWVSPRNWWWTGKPGILQSMGSQRVGHDSATDLTDWLQSYSYTVLETILCFLHLFPFGDKLMGIFSNYKRETCYIVI